MRDADVRKAVRTMLHAQHAGDDHTRIVEEMGIWSGSVRIDIAVINGELHGFELKSAKDTLDRLPRQAALYNEVFDRVTLVVANRHADKAMVAVPHWWGICLADGSSDEDVRLCHARASETNPDLKPIQLARLLWRAEALEILTAKNLVRGFRSKSAEILAERLASHVSKDDLRFEVRSALKRRNNWLGQLGTNERDVPIQAEAHPALAIS
jgi:hypothetical protein